MTKIKNSAYSEITEILSKAYIDIENIPEYIKESATDIHISVGQPVLIYCLGLNRYTTKNVISPMQMDNIFFKLCDYSIYKHTEEIKNGFITIGGKYRCGICGTCVKNGKDITSIKNITSLNIRIPHTVENVSQQIFEFKNNISKGLLIIGEPSSGKTTILKDIVSKLSNKRLVVIDERYELSMEKQECDVMLGYNKDQGISQAIRTMSPQFILCDELDYDDIDGVKLAVSTGVSVIASVHGKFDKREKPRQVISDLIDTGAFSTIVMLKGRLYPSVIGSIWDVGEFNEIFRNDNPDK